MGKSAQKRAIETYRSRLAERGMARFEVQALATDRDLIRDLARKMSDNTAEAEELRGVVQKAVAGDRGKKGGILAALLRAPRMDSDMDFQRSRDEPREVDL